MKKETFTGVQQHSYAAPVIEVQTVFVESGFAVSEDEGTGADGDEWSKDDESYL